MLDSEPGTAPAFTLEGLCALVTGGGSGIGAAIVRELSSAGASLIIADLNQNSANEVAAQIPSAQVVQLDVTNDSQIRGLASDVSSLDILINNAGVGHVGDIERTEVDDFLRLQSINATSVFLVTKAFLPQLLRNHGIVINIASVAGLVGVKERFAYCASKGAVIAMTKQLAIDYAGRLRVNCVCPGTVDSPFVEGYLKKFHAGSEEETRKELASRQPIGRLGRPQEIASLVRYLCSREAEFIQGAAITIDGGWTAA